jgi:predicted ribosomally synthesized peptide with SipW-like signal peptide
MPKKERDTMSKKTKRYLMLLVAVGLIAVAAGGSGTFASFNAEVTNSNNTFASGTLFLHDTPNSSATVCKSEDNLSNNTYSGCTFLFNKDLSAGSQTATLALNNAGTISASALTFKVTGCGVADNSAVTHSTVVFGTPPTCGDMYMTIQETGSLYDVPTSDAYCAFGPSTTQPDCDAPDNTATLATPTGYTPLTAAGNVPADLASGATRYYVIRITPTVASDNSLQNRKVSFGLTWHIEQ